MQGRFGSHEAASINLFKDNTSVNQLIWVTMLAILALSTPGVAGAVEFNAPVNSTANSGSILHDPTEVTAVSQPEANAKKDAGPKDADPSRSSRPRRWTVSAEAIVFERVGTTNRTLVERVPGVVSFARVPATPGTPALNSTDLNQGFAPGFRVGVTYHANTKYDWQLSFFRVSGWDSSRSIGPDNPPNWLVMRAPGFLQTQDFSYQSMTWDYSTELYNAELNVRYNLAKRVTVLGGFRWLQLNENLQGTIPPQDRALPIWKFDPNLNLLDVARLENLKDIPAGRAFPPFWNTSTKNNLYGLQIGAEGKLFKRGGFSIDGLIKVGGYWNHASASTGVSLEKVVHPTVVKTDHAAFVGEAGLQGKYQFAMGLAVKLGYQALWLYGVALAPGQIQETYETGPASMAVHGVNSNAGVLLHGVTAGLQYSF
jgi:hypothetical protein